MSAIFLESLFILLLIIANGVFAGSEIAVVSARKARLQQLLDQGNIKARAALKLANSPNNFLSTVQIGITLVGILSGALGGATVAQRLEPTLEAIPALAPYSEGLSVGIVVSIITYLSLVVGELLPKRIALSNPEQIAIAIASPMRLLSRITAPFVHLLSASTDGLLNLLGIRPSEEQPVTEEEIKVLIRQGTLSGTFEASEQAMVERVFRLGDRPIKGLMTPRTEIYWLNLEASWKENQDLIMESPHSRFPVGRGTLDDCVGIVGIKNIFSAYLTEQEIQLESLLLPPLYIAENTRALKVLELFKQTGTHIALVIDEYGGVEGLVTLIDIVEAIVGDLPSAEDQEDPMVVQREDGSWLIDGLLSVDQFKDLFNKETLPAEDTDDYHTLGGLVVTFLRKIPKSGDHFEWDNLRFEVVDMDGTRVDKVLVELVQTEEVASETQTPNDD